MTEKYLAQLDMRQTQHYNCSGAQIDFDMRPELPKVQHSPHAIATILHFTYHHITIR